MVAWLQRHPIWADLLASVVLAVALPVITRMGFGNDGLDATAYRCCALAGLAFAVRRVMPAWLDRAVPRLAPETR